MVIQVERDLVARQRHEPAVRRRSGSGLENTGNSSVRHVRDKSAVEAGCCA
jgi:hypothetical protein